MHKCYSLLLLLGLLIGVSVLTGLDFIKNLLVGLDEGLLETVGESDVTGGTLGLLGATSLGSLLLKGGGTGLLAGLDGLGLGGGESLSSGVESLHGGLVLERVLLALGRDVGVLALHAELALDLVRVDDSGEVGAGHHGSSELEASLGGGTLSVGTEDVVELLEGVLGEDDKSANVTAGGELEEVHSVDTAGVDTGEVSGGLFDGGVVVTVDDQGTSAEGEATIAHLALTSTELLAGADALEVSGDTDVLEDGEELSGLVLVEAVNNEGELGNIVDLVTTGHNEGTASGGGEGGSNSVSLLVKVNLSVPFSEEHEGSEHAALTAHVTEGTLTGTVSTGARDSWDSSDGTTGTPGLGGVLVASHVVDGVTLSSVLGHVGVAELDEIVSDGGREDGGHGGGAGDAGAVGGVHTDGRTGSHFAIVLSSN